MRIGIDFDNTLVCYDEAFYRAAGERALIPSSVAPTKTAVRDYLRGIGREDDWTELQGYVYGKGIGLASPFPGALEFIERCVADGVEVFIVSHKTRTPYRGASDDLHEAALGWLTAQGIFDRIGLPRSRVFFELTKEQKLARIAAESVTVFIDDLPELLSEASFPTGVRRLLFAPNGEGSVPGGIERVASWDEIARMLLDVPPAARELVESAGYGAVRDAVRLVGGANNRVFRIETERGALALKQYFTHPEDRWNRLDAEWNFARFAWDAGVREIPEPVACDRAAGIALYGFVEGRRVAPGSVGTAEVEAALAFIDRLSAARDRASGLTSAAEACFTIADHVALVDARVRALGLSIDPTADAQAARFVADDLTAAWERIRSGIEARAGTDAPLDPHLRCISPSDFGFHNALRTNGGRLVFHDFEYAGWDDPAKLAGDFFNQVAVPVPRAYFERFVARVARAVGDDRGTIAERAEVLLPAYTIKWCCIVLNEFRTVGSARRRFAGSLSDEGKATQLLKARELLETQEDLARRGRDRFYRRPAP